MKSLPGRLRLTLGVVVLITACGTLDAIPDLTADGVIDLLEDQGMDCDFPTLDGQAAVCVLPHSGLVALYGSPDRIRCVAGGGLEPFLSLLATLPYRTAEPLAARDWVESRNGVMGVATRSFGGVELEHVPSTRDSHGSLSWRVPGATCALPDESAEP